MKTAQKVKRLKQLRKQLKTARLKEVKLDKKITKYEIEYAKLWHSLTVQEREAHGLSI